MKRLLQAALIALAVCTLALPGSATATPGGDTSPTPVPIPAPPAGGERPLYFNFSLGGEHYPTATMPTVEGARYDAPALRYGELVPLSTPQSLVVYRGTATIISMPVITAYAPPLAGDTEVFNPSEVTPAWVSNFGSAVGSAMTAAIIVGHNAYGGVESPLYRLNTVRPGDLIDVTLRSGRVVRFQVDANGAVPGPKVVAGYELPRRTLTLRSCSPDGKWSITVTAYAVSM